MTAQVDLHLHTTASDGSLSPARLVEFVAGRGIRVAAVTDHDTTDGLVEAAEAAALYSGLTLIPGVELSADVPGTEVHVLGYFIDRGHPALQQRLEGFRVGRERRARRMVARLEELGMPLEWERVRELAQGAIGRPHIAQALVERGYVADMAEAFDRYLGRDGPAYAARPRLTPEQAVALIREAGGLPVLAHPAFTQGYASFLPSLKAAGLVGMEVYYGAFSGETVRELEQTAAAEGLLPCGGSDYHGTGSPVEPGPADAGPPLGVAARLLEMAGK